MVEAVYIRVEHVESVGVPQCSHELALTLCNYLVVELIGQPGSGIRVEVPPYRVRAVLFERCERVNGVALGLGHLLAVLIEHKTEYNYVLVGCLVEKQSAYRHEGEEPAACLVNGFGYEVCRELALEKLLVLEGIVVLCEGHSAGVEPAVYYLGYALHLLAAFGALDGHGVDVRAVKLYILGAVVGHRPELLDRTYRMAAAALALPYNERSTPVTVARDAPVLNVFQPVAETSLTDILRVPVYRRVVRYQPVLDGGHLNEPAVAGVVYQRRLAAPAVGVLMLELGCGEKLAFAVKVFEHLGVCLLHEESRVGGLSGHIACAVNELNEGQVILSADVRVVLTECGSDMNDTGTV